ncbi:MetQ/NlpA family ABC transporter substrate-binding protein [Clostridium sardiniense]
MKKRGLISTVLVGVLSLALVGCGGSSKDDKTITIGVTPVPHKEIVEHIKPKLEEKGYKVNIKEFTDYVTPNKALSEGSLDANFFQHIPYLNKQNEAENLGLTYTAKVHLEPLGLYSKNIKDIKDLKDGATIAIPNDPSNEARALKLLESHGLIKVKEGELVTPKDITENKKNFEFKELEAAAIPRALDDVDAAVINGNYAIDAGFSVKNDALIVEDKDSKAAEQYANIIAVKEADKDSQKIKDLTETLTSEDVKNFINDKYDGAVIPVF